MTPLQSTLADLIRINSVNSFYADGPGEGELADYVAEFFAGFGIPTTRQTVFPGRDNVIARLPGRSPGRRVILEAHMDTVSVQGMTAAPFDPCVDDKGRMYGRGSCDTKAGLAAMMHAVADVERSGIVPPCEVWLAAVVDEEYSFRGVVKLCEGLTATAAVVAEPTDMRAIITSKGVLRWRMISQGIAAHSSKTHLGVNAINHMARVVLALEHDHQRLTAAYRHPLLGPASCNVGRIEGGVQVNFVPDRCTIEIDRRLLPNESVANVLMQYQQLLDRLRQSDPTFDVQMESPMLVDDCLDTPADCDAARLSSQLLIELGLSGELGGVPFGSDASKLSKAGIPSLIIGPGNIDQAHAATEFVVLHQVAAAHEFYRQFITRFE